MSQFYINSTIGDDTVGAGTLASPWLTIAKAYNSSAVNDTINVAAGTYSWVNQTFSTSRIVAGAALVQGSTLPTTIFDGSAGVKSWTFGETTMQVNNIMFQNFIHTSTGDSVFIGNSLALVTMKNCVIRNGTMFDGGGSSGSGIVGKCASGNGTFYFLNGLMYNIVAGTGGSGCYFGLVGNANWGTVIVRNSTFYTSGANPCAVTNRTAAAGQLMTMKNCIFYSASSRSWHVIYNDYTYVNCSGNLSYNYTGVPITVIVADPLFIDAANGNFNLKPNSPCIDAGTLT